MSGITRYAVIETALCIGSNLMEGEVFMVMATDHDRELAALREELEHQKSVSKIAIDDAALLQKSLTSAEQRNSELESRLRHFASCADVRRVGTLAMDFVEGLAKPTESGASE